MQQHLAHIAVVVRDYDEAIHYYTTVLGFKLIEDTVLSETKRWVMVQPTGANNGCMLLLAKAASPEQEKFIGYQTGGRVFLFLYTDDFQWMHVIACKSSHTRTRKIYWLSNWRTRVFIFIHR